MTFKTKIIIGGTIITIIILISLNILAFNSLKDKIAYANERCISNTTIVNNTSNSQSTNNNVNPPIIVNKWFEKELEDDD